MPACLWYLNFAPIDPENRRNKKRLGLFQAPRQDHRHCKEAQGKPMTEKDLVREFDEISAKFAAAREGLGQVIFGQEEVIELTLATLAAGGHALLVGAPGLAKTLLVTSVADLMGLSAKRVQFTPDLMPGAVLGSEVLEESASGAREFRIIPSPIFCQLLMADEINRASPRTQSAT